MRFVIYLSVQAITEDDLKNYEKISNKPESQIRYDSRFGSNLESESYQKKSVTRISNPNLKKLSLGRISNLESESLKMIYPNPNLESESRFLLISRI